MSKKNLTSTFSVAHDETPKEELSGILQTARQKALTDAVVNAFVNNIGGNLFLAKSAPGSGKTTTIVETLKKILNELPDESEQKVLVLAFNRKMKEEIEERIKKAGISLSRVDIKTIHSLFFQNTWRFENNEKTRKGAFQLDFQSGFFNRKMIRQIILSMISGESKYGEYLEKAIGKSRVFTSEIKNEDNVSILYRYINAYFSSPCSPNEIDRLDSISLFFAKNDNNPLPLKSLKLGDADKAHLEASEPELITKGYSAEEVFFFYTLKQINLMAKLRNIVHTSEPVPVSRVIPIEFLDSSGRKINVETNTEGDEKLSYVFEHIFKVPHNYYYKEFFKKAFEDHGFMKNVFGQYSIVFIDEAQDNDLIFYKILIEAMRKKIIPNAVAVGDPDQSIYAFKSPDHFDILESAAADKQGLLSSGIKVLEYPLAETHRFGEEIAGFVNTLFPTSNIIGKENFSGAVYDQVISTKNLSIFLNNTASQKKLKIGIICRTNNEAMQILIDLKKSGCNAAKLHSSIKSNLKDFFTSGSKAIDDERVRVSIAEVLGFDKKSSFTYQDVVNSEDAKKILIKNGYSQLIRFDKDDVEKYVFDNDRSRKNVVITTAHQSKGAEFDYAVIASDFFKQEGEQNSETTPIVKAVSLPASMMPAMAISTEEKIEQNCTSGNIVSVLNDPSCKEERNAFYVAITRAKEKILFMEGGISQRVVALAIEAGATIKSSEMIGPMLVENAELGSIFNEENDPQEESVIMRGLFD
jgi:hypothetical protein